MNLLNDLVRETPSLSIKAPISYVNALKETCGKPMIIRQAKGLAYTLDSLPIIIRQDEIIVGTFDENIPVAIPRLEASGFRIMRELDTISSRKINPIKVKDEDIRKLREEIAPYYQDFRIDTYAKEIAPEFVFETSYSGCAYVATELGGIAHAVINYRRILSIGLKNYINLAEDNINRLKEAIVFDTQADEKIAFYKAMIITSKALIKYSNKYAQKAIELAKNEPSDERRLELEKNCSYLCKDT